MITVHFYRQDPDELVVQDAVVNDRIVLRREPARCYRETGLAKIAYMRQAPAGLDPESADFDMLTCALEHRTAFTAEEFWDQLAGNLAAAGLNYIANTIAGLLRTVYKETGVIIFDLKDIDRCVSD